MFQTRGIRPCLMHLKKKKKDHHHLKKKKKIIEISKNHAFLFKLGEFAHGSFIFKKEN